MVELLDIGEIVTRAASASLSPGSIRRVISEPMADWTGADALQVVIVLNEGAATHLSDQQAVDVLHSIRKELRDSGEERFAFIKYATEKELAADANTES